MSLKLERVARRVKATKLAAAMGVTSSRVSAIEAQAVVTEATAERYLRALATCATSGTSTLV